MGEEQGVPGGSHPPTGPFLDPVRLTELLSGASFPAALWSGAELRFLWVNRAFLELLQGSPPRFDALGMPVRGFLSDAESAMRFQDVAYTGLPQTVAQYEHRSLEGDLSYWQLTFLPMPGRFAGPSDVLLTGIDVSPSVRAERQSERLSVDLREAADLIDTTILSSLDAEEILQRVVVEATEAFNADWGWIADREPGAWVFRNVHGWPEETVGQRFREEELSLPRVAADARDVVAEDGSGGVSPEHEALLRQHDIGAFLVVPLFARGEVSAVIGFCWNAATHFVDAHLQLAEKLATSLSLALENARLYASERDAARTLHSAFFTVPERIDGIEFGHLYHSASVGTGIGGDFYDVIEAAPGKVGVVIGDVSGHGIAASAITALVKSSVRVEALGESSPEAIMARTNELVLREARADMFASAFVGMLDTRDGCLAYCLAGHPAPVLARHGQAPTLLPGPQVVIGVDAGARYVNNEACLEVGDLLVLYTDGLVEARDRRGTAYGVDRLRWAVGGLVNDEITTVPESLFLDAFSYAEGRLRDDVAILAMRRTEDGGDAPHQERLELPLAPA